MECEECGEQIKFRDIYFSDGNITFCSERCAADYYKSGLVKCINEEPDEPEEDEPEEDDIPF